MSSKINTFWSLISEHQIEIPVIQRDYAQGRENKHVNQIRTGIVTSLLNALAKKEQYPLGFIYGKIEGKEQEKIQQQNKEAVGTMMRAVKSYANTLALSIDYKLIDKNINTTLPKTKLIPLDGQQRLTTLYLLHWYLIQLKVNDDNTKKELLDVLKGFTYKTKKTTRNFCSAITNHLLNEEDFKEHKISDIITQKTWFLKKWLLDPSIKGMLVMLDEIQNQINSIDNTNLLKNLINEPIIIFDFLDLDELKQTDILYVKMNARGKTLSDFEHFKAWLIEETKNTSLIEKDWNTKIDTIWYDLFWRHKNDYTVDNTIFNFIKNIALYAYLVTDNNDFKKRYFINLMNPNTYVSHKDFKDYGLLNSKTLNYIFKSLNTLSTKNLQEYDNWLKDIFCEPFAKKDTKITNLFIRPSKSIDYYERVYYYAFNLFIISDDNIEDKEGKFKNWMRITRNLIYNTYIQNPENFIKAINSINELSENIYDINAYFLSDELNVSFFSKTQVKEETLKLSYFNDVNFKAAIIQYENHHYFYGQIGMLFNILEKNEKNNVDLFTSYANSLDYYFNPSIEKKPWKLQRKMLMYSNYFVHKSGNKFLFCKQDGTSLRARNDNWRQIFNANIDSDTFKAFKNVIRNNPELNINEIDDWRKYFIEYPDVFSYCKETFIDFYNEFDIRLIKQKTYNGKHADLYSFILYLYLSRKGFSNIDIKYNDVNYYRTATSFPLISIFDKNNNTIIIEIYYNPVKDDNKKGEFIIETPLLNFFKNKERINDKIYISINSIKDVDKLMEEISNELKTIKL